jgi:hypothetical protein
MEAAAEEEGAHYSAAAGTAVVEMDVVDSTIRSRRSMWKAEARR